VGRVIRRRENLFKEEERSGKESAFSPHTEGGVERGIPHAVAQSRRISDGQGLVKYLNLSHNSGPT